MLGKVIAAKIKHLEGHDAVTEEFNTLVHKVHAQPWFNKCSCAACEMATREALSHLLALRRVFDEHEACTDPAHISGGELVLSSMLTVAVETINTITNILDVVHERPTVVDMSAATGTGPFDVN